MQDHFRYIRMWADVLYVGQPNGCHGISPAMPKQRKNTRDNIGNTVGHKCFT